MYAFAVDPIAVVVDQQEQTFPEVQALRSLAHSMVAVPIDLGAWDLVLRKSEEYGVMRDDAKKEL